MATLIGSKALAPNFSVLLCTPVPSAWGGVPVIPSSGMVLAAGDTCACRNPTWIPGVWHRKCESVWQPPQAHGRWDPKVSPPSATSGTPSIAPPGVLWGSHCCRTLCGFTFTGYLNLLPGGNLTLVSLCSCPWVLAARAVPHSSDCSILGWVGQPMKPNTWASVFGVQGKLGGFAFLPG